mmetsp:Transcript_21921/g.38497  ORF Transcript_21921/g.38497 Transcript_21921/m.38497 type:complete len:288 (+) Transcript_21921:167-1030(+)
MSISKLTLDRADAVVQAMEKALDEVLSAQGNVVAVTRAEVNLLVEIEAARDLLLLALQSAAQRAALREVFGGDCRRIELMRAILEESTFSEMNASDQRPAECLRACESVERVLEDLGLGEALRKAREESHMRKALPADDGVAVPQHQPDVNRTNAPPPELRGHLLKKSPQLLGSFQERQVELKEARLSWWRANTDLNGTAPEPKGFIDFRENPCLVDVIEANPGRFVLRPKHGEWRSGEFTGADRGRKFVFDASSSEVDRSEWLQAIQNHIRYGEGKYQNPQISYRW